MAAAEVSRAATEINLICSPVVARKGVSWVACHSNVPLHASCQSGASWWSRPLITSTTLVTALRAASIAGVVYGSSLACSCSSCSRTGASTLLTSSPPRSTRGWSVKDHSWSVAPTGVTNFSSSAPPFSSSGASCLEVWLSRLSSGSTRVTSWLGVASATACGVRSAALLTAKMSPPSVTSGNASSALSMRISPVARLMHGSRQAPPLDQETMQAAPLCPGAENARPSRAHYLSSISSQ